MGVGRRIERQADYDVERAAAQFAQQRLVGFGAHDETHIWPALAEPRQRPWQDRGDIIARGADPYHQFRAGRGAAEMHDLIVDREQAARIADDHFPVRGQADALHAAVEHLAAEQELQALDLGADRRLGQAKRDGGLGKAAQIDDGDQSTQKIRRDISHLAPSIPAPE
jgi:hypothetical protein